MRAKGGPPAGVCNACWLYQHFDCELPNRCTCTICHPASAASAPTDTPHSPQGTPTAGALTGETEVDGLLVVPPRSLDLGLSAQGAA